MVMTLNTEHLHEEVVLTLAEAKAILRAAELYVLKDSWSGARELDWTTASGIVASGIDGMGGTDVTVYPDGIPKGIATSPIKYCRFIGDEAHELFTCFSSKDGGWN